MLDSIFLTTMKHVKSVAGAFHCALNDSLGSCWGLCHTNYAGAWLPRSRLRSGMDQAPWVMNDTVTNNHKLLKLPQLPLASSLPCNVGIGNLRFRSIPCCINALASLSFRFAGFEVSTCVSASRVRPVCKMCVRGSL